MRYVQRREKKKRYVIETVDHYRPPEFNELHTHTQLDSESIVLRTYKITNPQ